MAPMICQPVSSRAYVVPGALPDRCSKCGQPVLVSPSTWLILHDNPGMEILCLPCAIAQIKKDGEFEIEGITLAQAEEIEEYLRLETKDD